MLLALGATSAQAGAATWSLQSTANPTPRTEFGLADVSCRSSTSCVGVGYNRYVEDSFVETWNGTSWSLFATTPGEIRKISCATTNRCLMIGTGKAGGPMAWLKLGSVFGPAEASIPVPEGGSLPILNDVSCISESDCLVVGRYRTEGGAFQPLSEQWNGSAWTLDELPPLSGGHAADALLAVSCGSAQFCVGVGSYEDAAGGTHANIEEWSGGLWSTHPFPQQLGVTYEGVSCSSETSCVTVGRLAAENGTATPIAQTWSGGSWTVSVPALPSEAKGSVVLNDISCTSPTSCTAVGQFVNAVGGLIGTTPTEERTLAESWNGTAWSPQSSANVSGDKFDSLAGVSCTAEKACTAVGAVHTTTKGGEGVTLGERYE